MAVSELHGAKTSGLPPVIILYFPVSGSRPQGEPGECGLGFLLSPWQMPALHTFKRGRKEERALSPISPDTHALVSTRPGAPAGACGGHSRRFLLPARRPQGSNSTDPEANPLAGSWPQSAAGQAGQLFEKSTLPSGEGVSLQVLGLFAPGRHVGFVVAPADAACLPGDLASLSP